MATETDDKIMMVWASQTVNAVVRGLVSCFQHVPLERVLILLCAVMAQQVARLHNGAGRDELTSFKFRRACRDAFDRAMSDEPHVKPQRQPGPASIGVTR